MKRVLFTISIVLIAVMAFAQEAEPKLDVFDFIRNADWINVALVSVMSVGVIAVYVNKGRSKIKEVGELLILLYEYTDDKVLDKKEREDIWNRILVIIGKKKASDIQAKVQEKSAKKYVHK